MDVDPKPVEKGKAEDRLKKAEDRERDQGEDGPGSTSFDEPEIESSDDEVDYSKKPEFYDPDLDYKDTKWAEKMRKGRASDALLSCPACFTTLCLDSQRHEKYITQYRAMFVLNCMVKKNEILRQGKMPGKRRAGGTICSAERENPDSSREIFRPVCCSVCSTEVGVLDDYQVYHFFNVLPSYS